MFKAPKEEPEYPFGHGWMGGIPAELGEPAELKDNEYRFWKGTNFIYEGPGWAQCRSCMIVCRTEELRKKHQKALGCTGHLIKAYKILLARKICVVCGMWTAGQKWGIPMCSSGDCRKDFKTRVFMYGFQEAINGNVAL